MMHFLPYLSTVAEQVMHHWNVRGQRKARLKPQKDFIIFCFTDLGKFQNRNGKHQDQMALFSQLWMYPLGQSLLSLHQHIVLGFSSALNLKQVVQNEAGNEYKNL